VPEACFLTDLRYAHAVDSSAARFSAALHASVLPRSENDYDQNFSRPDRERQKAAEPKNRDFVEIGRQRGRQTAASGFRESNADPKKLLKSARFRWLCRDTADLSRSFTTFGMPAMKYLKRCSTQRSGSTGRTP
jgi:hypothetical protein